MAAAKAPATEKAAAPVVAQKAAAPVVAQKKAAAPQPAASIGENVAEAQAWIDAWKKGMVATASTHHTQQEAGGNDQHVADAQKWIDRWRAERSMVGR